MVTVDMAKIAMRITKFRISSWRVVASCFAPAVSTDIEPIIVLAPVWVTMPLPVPFMTIVAMNAMFLDSV